MKRSIAIIGGGSCALFLGCLLDPQKFQVSIYERNAALGRKFLVAGDGGLNLTHSEDKARFIERYTPSAFIEKAFLEFSNSEFISWINDLGIETFVGSSGRVFPRKDIKPIEVLNRMLDTLKKNKVALHTKHKWMDVSEDGTLLIEHAGEVSKIEADRVVFCMGGASWPVTGSTGEWSGRLQKKQIKVNPFRPSNSSFTISWPESLLPKIEGRALKNIRIRCAPLSHAGEVVLTRTGLEGSGIYPLSPAIRTELEKNGKAMISIDLKPLVPVEKIESKLRSRTASLPLSSFLKKELNMDQVQIALLKFTLTKEDFLHSHLLAKAIKGLELEISGTGALEDAISTVGGIALEEIDADFQLKRWKQHYAIGEMLDYDAPTGGYLLQSCFSMAAYLARHLNSL